MTRLSRHFTRLRAGLVPALLLAAGCAAGERPEPASAPPDTLRAGVERGAPVPAGDPTYADRRSWRGVLHWPDSCEQGFHPPDSGFGGLAFHPLGGSAYLVQVTCASGAYQGSQRFYRYDASASPPATPLEFTTYSAPGDRLVRSTTPELWGHAAYEPGARALVVLNRFRGPGDCGTRAVYDLGGAQPRLTELRAKLACDGTGAETPERWAPVPLDAEDP